MKITCKREGLLMACRTVAAAIPAKAHSPVLKNIRFIASENSCTLDATDLEIGVRAKLMGVEVWDAGDALLPAERLVAILRESDSEDVSISADMATSTIVASGRYEMPGSDPANFPPIPELARPGLITIDASALQQLIRRSLFAVASTEHSRFVATTGVGWEIGDRKLTLVGIDGRRAAIACAVAQCEKKSIVPVLPAKAMNLIERNVEGEGEVAIEIGQNDAIIRTDRLSIVSRLIEGRFPNFRQVVPAKFAHRLEIECGPLLRAVRRASIMETDESKGVDFEFGNGKLTIRAGSTFGSSEADIPIAWTGAAKKIRFDPAYVADFLKTISPEVVVSFAIGDPSILQVGDDYQYVLVPLGKGGVS